MITKAFLVFLCCCVSLIGHSTFAGGTSVIGNGAGIVENNIQFVYSTLPNVVAECIRTKRCENTPSESKTLAKMLTVFSTNSSNPDRILFVSEKTSPGFFDTGVNEQHRIAKTGLTAQDPIYINIDLLYDSEGKPSLDLPTIASILVHEVGHQTGETNHAYLDIIGSKVKKMLNEKTDVHGLKLNDGTYLEVTVINHKFPYLISDLLVSWQGTGLKNLSQDINTTIKCNSGDLSGLEIFNSHFTSVDFNQPDQKIGFGVWINVYCFSETLKTTTVETKSMELEIRKDLSVKILNFNDLQ